MDAILHNPLFGVGVLFIVMVLGLFIESFFSGSPPPKDKKKK